MTKACPNMSPKGARAACPKSRAFEQDSPFSLGVTCCRKTPPKPLDTYKACPSPMSKVKTKNSCNAYAVRSRVIRSNAICCRKTKPTDQKVLNTVKVARLLRHKNRAAKKSDSLIKSESVNDSLDTPHVSDNEKQDQKVEAKSPSKSSLEMPSHVSTPRGSSSPKMSSAKAASSPKMSSAKAASSPKMSSAKAASSPKISSAKAASSPKIATKSETKSSNKSLKVESKGLEKKEEELASLLNRLKMSGNDQRKSGKKAGPFVVPKQLSKSSEKKQDLSPEEYNHFMELLAEHVAEHAPVPISETMAIAAVDSPHGLSPDQLQDFEQLFQNWENHEQEGSGKFDQDHFDQLFDDWQAQAGQDSLQDDDQPFDNTVKFRPHAQFNLHEYLKRHRQDVTGLQSQFPGSDKGKWYSDRLNQADVARIELASLLEIIREMEGASPNDKSVADRLFKITGMAASQSKPIKKYFVYDSLRLKRVQEYIRKILGLAKVNTAVEAARVWRSVKASPENRLMMYYMVALIVHTVVHINNDIAGKGLALGAVMYK